MRPKSRPIEESTPCEPGRAAVWAGAMALACVTLGLYSVVTLFGFVALDDPGYVYENARVTGGLTWENFRWFLTHGHGGNWHPLTSLSHMLDCHWFGLNAGIHHALNVLLHCANAVLVFLLARQLTGGFWRSWFVAALFAAHPLRVESVAWISERKDVLSAFFFLLAVLAYIRYARARAESGENAPAKNLHARKGALLFWTAVGCHMLGLLSKPMVVTLPCVLLLLDWWPLGRCGDRFVWRKAVALAWEKWPFFLLSAADCWATLLMQKQAGAVVSLAQLPLLERLANCLVGYWSYLKATLWPSGLAVFYACPDNWPAWEIAQAASGVLVINVAALWWARSRPFLLVGWLWFAGMLTPVSGLFQTGSQAYADRYTYLPSIGLFLACACLVSEFVRRRRLPAPAFVAAGVCLLGIFFVVTWRQIGFWRDAETLYRRAVTVVPKNFDACMYFGDFLAAQRRFDEAQSCYAAALQVHRTAPLLGRIGGLELRRGNLDQAEQVLREALRQDPLHDECNRQLGRLYSSKDLPQSARFHFEQALRRNPVFVPGLRDFAWFLATRPAGTTEDAQRAIWLARRAVELATYDRASGLAILAGACAQAGDFDQAIQVAEQAVVLAQGVGDAKTIKRCQQHLESYRRKQPIRDE